MFIGFSFFNLSNIPIPFFHSFAHPLHQFNQDTPHFQFFSNRFSFSVYLHRYRNKMVFEDFRNEFFNQICFNSNQVLAWHPGFDKNNLGRWIKKGYIIKLRNGYYSFTEQLGIPNFNLYVANCIYRPSYISLHTALVFYGLIPESVIQTTSVSTLKTARFENKAGSFSYKKMKENLFFGYEPLPFTGGKTILLATPEKALLDLLYLYPFYRTETDMSDLRLNEELLHETINTDQLIGFLSRFEKRTFEKRVKILIRVYEL